ncbi:MAG: hypothetical protein Q4A04_01015 [Eubacteriales bacterium]|nr:hypothetical protein [Eubacteriales bacterium]
MIGKEENVAFPTKNLIIKNDYDEFELFVSEYFTRFADVIATSELCKGNSGNAKKQLYANIRKLNRKHYFDKYDKIIVFDNMTAVIALLATIRHKDRIILWFWNIMRFSPKDYLKLKLIKYFCAAWTFDFADAKKYRINLNTQFYPLIACSDISEATTDLFFVGLNKGRKPLLDCIEKVCQYSNIRCSFVVVGEKKSDGSIQQPINYSQVLDHIKHTKAILEICQEGQTGLTVRAMEAIYFNRKLITNNDTIYSKKYFNENNTLIIDESNYDKIADFLQQPFYGFPDEARKYYSIESWLERFDTKSE